MIVFGFVDTYAPKNDGGMVPVAPNHAPHVVDGDLLPRLVPDVLPARDFFQHQQTDLVARIKNVSGLRVVGRPNDISSKFVAKNVRVAPLRAARHRLPHAWKGLMTIKAAQLDDLAVQFESVIGKLRFAEAD